jgi:tetratricopeptide (TPR) repeat protein
MKIVILSLVLIISFQAVGKVAIFDKVYSLYKDGDYKSAVKLLDSIPKNSKMSDKVMAKYWSAICLVKMQRFEQANKKFNEILFVNDLPDDYYFEFGKSLYAVNEIELAEKMFKQSILRGHEQFSSAYYLGHIKELLGEDKLALNYYSEIVNDYKTPSATIQQSAFYKKGEIIVSTIPKKGATARDKIRTLAVPQYISGIELDDTLPLAKKMKQKVNSLYRQYWLGAFSPYRRVKANQLKFNQSFLYDTNVTMESDNASSGSSSDSSAPASKSQLIYKYSDTLGKQVFGKTSLRLNWDYYLDRENSDIYQNDSFSIAPSFNGMFRNYIFNNPGELLVGVDYNYSMRDFEAKDQLSYYGQSATFFIGEKFSLFDFGKSVFKFKTKLFYSYDKTLDSKTFTLFFNQYYSKLISKMLLFTFNADFSFVEDSSLSTNSFMLRCDYIHPKFYHSRVVLHSGLGVSFTDTKEQSSTRGVETNLSPFTKVSYNFNKYINVSGKYTYTKNISKNKTVYDYSKHVALFELETKY